MLPLYAALGGGALGAAVLVIAAARLLAARRRARKAEATGTRVVSGAPVDLTLVVAEAPSTDDADLKI